MALRHSEIDRIIDNGSDSDSSLDDGLSGSELDNGILSYSGSDSYEPSSTNDSEEEDYEIQSKRKRVHTVGRKKSISALLQSMETSNIQAHVSNSPLQGPDNLMQVPDSSHQPTTSTSRQVQSELQCSPGTSERDSSTSAEDIGILSQESDSTHRTTPRYHRVIKGKNGYAWTTEPRTSTSRTNVRNIVYNAPKVKGIAKNATTPSESFLSFISEEDIGNIVTFTNHEITRKQTNYKEITATFEHTDTLEIKAFIGILLFSAVHKDNHLNLEVMFDTECSGNLYRCTFSEKRFKFLLDCLRFDDKETRDERRVTDKFAAIRDFWNSFINKCTANYEPGPYLTIDEQLLAFRGRCPFKMYMPQKPSKYGIKIVMICDVGTKYMLNAEPYLGKGTTGRDEPVSHYHVKNLSAPYHGSNRNLTMDNWFSSIPLTLELLRDPINLTVIGTIRKNKRELPECMTTTKNRPVGDIQYLYDGKIVLVSQKVKTNKVVCLISSMHDKGGTSASGKPFIVEHYNQTKGGVDAFDQMCSVVSCSRKTKRWPMCIFFGLLNMAGINSWVTYNLYLRNKNGTKISRSSFLAEVHKDLVTPHLERRLMLPTLQRSLKSMISEILKKEPLPDHPPINNTRTTCKICPTKKRRMTTNHCIHCRQAYCNEHRGNVCCKCTDHE